jgi:superfamily II DNA or RNA helicase
MANKPSGAMRKLAATKIRGAVQDRPKKVKKKSSNSPPPKLSRLRRPDGLSLEEWQRALRHQFGVEQGFKIENIGAEPVFSEFHVINPESRNSYRVAIRGNAPGENFCSCPDFATNTLGTCKHVEFTLATLARRRGGKAAFKAGFHPEYSEVFLQYGARREIRLRPARACPREFVKLAADFFGPDGMLLPAKYAALDRFITGARRLNHELRCYDDALAFLAEVRDAERRRERIERAFPQGIGSAAFEKLLKISIYDYQREGALFAARAGRSLIGDEMGLGKTIQALAAAEIMACELGVDRVLVICPTSLKHQWEREIARFVERSVSVIGGLRARRAEQFGAVSFFKIMNYDTVHSDLDLIQAWSPDLVILDEAQRIKNWNTRAARSVKKIASPYAIVLTGTPLENRLEELVSIVQFVDPHRLGPTFRFLHEHQVLDETGRVVGYRDLDRIGKTLAPILIRRQKKQVLDQLPERLDKNFFVPMTLQQVKHHDENKEIVGGIVKRWKRLRFLSEVDQRRLMIALQNMRMACDSTYLLDRATDFGVKADELMTLLEEVFERPETKVVIFSQWLGMHEVLLRRFHERGWDHVLFHGGVPGSQRKGLVDRFRDNAPCRIFLATDAGGVGLNLQHASMVVNMDLPWNPAVLEQRIGRVHRLGQKNPVQVVNFVAQGTIEESMLGVLSFKQSLFAGALDGGEKDVFMGGTRLNRFMQGVEEVTGSISEAPVAVSAEAELSAPIAAEELSRGGPGNGDAMADRGEAGHETNASPTENPWPNLLRQGAALLQQLATASSGAYGAGAAAAASRNDQPFVRRDALTGESYLHIPMPAPEMLDQALRTLSALLDSLRR